MSTRIVAIEAASAGTGVSFVFKAPSPTKAFLFLSVTSAAAAATDTLDVFVQHSLDKQTWDDFVHFTQVLGNDGPRKYLAVWAPNGVEQELRPYPDDGQMPVGVRQNPVGPWWRVKWSVAGATASFTFSVDVQTG